MLASLEELLAIIDVVYGPQKLPRAFQILRAVGDVRNGADASAVARTIGSTARRLLHASEAADSVAEILKCTLTDVDPVRFAKNRASLGQLVLGQLAERAFEDTYRRTIGSELRLEDLRETRNETDFRVLNGHDRPVFRINIKFHGTLFRNAAELVGLEPQDCFALATYKIWQAIEKQRQEVLPYVFAVVSVPHLTAESVGQQLADDLIHLVCLVHASKMSGKRDVEDRIVEYVLRLAGARQLPAITGFSQQITQAQWRLLSARKADLLLREKLFDRVYAVRVRAFARNYRNAELDMHFSLKNDLTTLEDFLNLFRERGIQGLTAHLERGLF